MISSAALVLASASRFKRDLMARLDLDHVAVGAHVDESPRPGEPPAALATRLAGAKARALRHAHPGAYILGADQVVSLDGALLHKPGSVERACAQLELLQGRTHDIFCAVALLTPSCQLHHRTVHYAMEMRALDARRIKAYVERDMPLDCAGSYMVERGGIQLFKSMRGEDYTAIVGLPLTCVLDLLLEHGYPV